MWISINAFNGNLASKNITIDRCIDALYINFFILTIFTHSLSIIFPILAAPVQLFSQTKRKGFPLCFPSQLQMKYPKESLPSPPAKFDVFLSFRGEDTRHGFTDQLYHALNQEGIFTFRDSEALQKGSSISPELLNAIADSRIAVIVLSANYANSTWCLTELAQIVECRESTGITIFPVFYRVEQSEVREQTGNFGKDFRRHEQNHPNIDRMKVDKWRKACNEVAKIPGPYLKESDGDHESKVIQQIARSVLKELDKKCSRCYDDDLVGMDARIEKMMSYLELGSEDVLTIGIYGVAGIGKTTLARAVYYNIRSEFDSSSFIDASKGNGIVDMQPSKMLIVLDDVDRLDYIQALGATKQVLGPGSRVIITTRDEKTLRALGVPNDKTYEIEKLTDDEAIQLFCKKALRENQGAAPEYIELSYNFVNLKYVGRLPFAVKGLGSFLYARGLDEWSAALVWLREDPDAIFDVLKLN